jgi:hypothetical protein
MPARKAGARSWPALRAIASGDAISARSRSVNHRLSSGKPPACPGGIVLPKSCQSRNTSYEYIGNSMRIITRYGIVVEVAANDAAKDAAKGVARVRKSDARK